MNALGPLNLINLLAVGTLLFLALSILDYRRGGWSGPRHASRDRDPIRIGLGVIAGLLTVAGIVGAVAAIAGPLTVPIGVVAFLIGILTIRQYYRTERQAVLPYLAVAMERRIPLATAARAYALERPDHFGRRSGQLAALLESGARLPNALRLSGHRFGLGSTLAVGIGDDFDCLDATLRQSMRDEQRLRRMLRTIGERLAYLSWVLVMTLGMHGFFRWKLEPMLLKIATESDLPTSIGLMRPLKDFGIVDPNTFATLQRYASLATNSTLLVAVGVSATLLLSELWWRWLPLVGRLSLTHDKSWVLRAMGWGIARGRPVSETLASVARHLPSGVLQRRVERAMNAVATGAPWTAALRAERLITDYDEVLLIAAETSGNLAWACEERAESQLRRQEYRWQRVISFVFPGVILLAAFEAFSLIGGVFRFLVDLMESLA
jgi:type II secretory pathway component PulF